MSITENLELFDNLPYIRKLQAVRALEQEDQHFERIRPIYKKIESNSTKIINIYEVGQYVFVEARWKMSKKGEEEILFTGGIPDDKVNSSMNRWSYTLEEAILDTFGRHFDGVNSQAGEMMARMLKIDTPQK